MASRQRLRRHLPKVTRDGVLFLVGLGGIVHETVIADQADPTLVLLFAAMVGLPAFLRTDERRD